MDGATGGEEGYTKTRKVESLRAEAERPGEAALRGLLTCRLHISELQSRRIWQCWVIEADPSLTMNAV